MQSTNPAQKNETNENPNCARKQFHSSVARGAQVSFHPARVAGSGVF
jgi:hypothetical protein